MPPALVHKSFKETRGSRTNHLMFGLGWHQKVFCLKSLEEKVSDLDMVEVSSEVVEPDLFIYLWIPSVFIHGEIT